MRARSGEVYWARKRSSVLILSSGDPKHRLVIGDLILRLDPTDLFFPPRKEIVAFQTQVLYHSSPERAWGGGFSLHPIVDPCGRGISATLAE